ncbi:MAG: PHB depolymerase family esterase [bacterium]
MLSAVRVGFLLSIALAASPAWADDLQRIEQRETSIVIPGQYQISVPASLPAGATLGLVVAIHGYQGSRNDFGDLDRRMGAKEYITVYPRGLIELYDDQGRASYCWAKESGMDIMLSLTEKFLNRVVAEVCQEYPIDPAKICIAGFSQGAAVAMYFALCQPGLIHRTACLSGGLSPDDNLLRALDPMPDRFFFFGWGNRDHPGVIEQARTLREAVQNRDWSNFSFREYEGQHELTSKELEDVCRFLSDVPE